MAMFRALQGKISQLALLAFAFLIVAALVAAWSIHSIKQRHDELSKIELTNLALVDEITQWGQDLVEAHQNAAAVLAKASGKKLDEGQIYLAHTRMVNDLARHARKLEEIARQPEINEVAASEARAMVSHFGEYRNFMVMATDIAAIDPSKASSYTYQAQEQYIRFMNYEQAIAAKLADHMWQTNQEGSQSINEFFRRVMLEGSLAVLAIAGFAFLMFRMTTRKLTVVTGALTGISQHQEAPPAMPEVE
ncbi:MAG: hypothetical protein OEV35_06960, partial [Gallionellaceae bacterium]|nr:hypothetical protein [Gallionellaceae bacterium]